MSSVFLSVRRYGCTWMVILFKKLFSIFHEAALNEKIWLSLTSPNYIAEVIINMLYPHEYIFFHVNDEYRHPHTLLHSFVSYYEYNTDLKTKPIRLRKLYVVKVDVYRTEDDEHANTTSLCLKNDSIIVYQTNIYYPSIRYNYVVVGESQQHGQSHSCRTSSCSATRPDIGNVAMVNVLGFCGTIDRFLYHLRKFTISSLRPFLITHSHSSPSAGTSFNPWYPCTSTFPWCFCQCISARKWSTVTNPMFTTTS